MTTSDYKKLQENFKPAKLVDDVLKIYKDISDITWILSSISLNMETARQKIVALNSEHPENYLLNSLMNPSRCDFKPIPIIIASSEDLRQDLVWKKNYLAIKAQSKTLDELIHYLESQYNRSL